jgi:hypothetical protein
MLASLADRYRRHRFAWLFGSLILTIAASPALHAIVSRVNAVELLLAINLVAVVSTVRREHGMGWMPWIGGTFLALRAGETASGLRAFVPFTEGLWVIGCSLGMLATARHAFRSGTIDAERIFAALDAYLLAGLVFGVCFWLLARLDPSAFNETSVSLARATYFQLRYPRDARVRRCRAEKRAGAEPRDRRGGRRPDVPRRPDRPAGEPVLQAGEDMTSLQQPRSSHRCMGFLDGLEGHMLREMHRKGKSMNRKIGHWIRVSSLVLMAAGLLGSAAPAHAEDRPADRQDARDTRQTGRDAARDAKAACREGDEKSRPECRQEKRGTKQDARDAAHDIKKTD